MAKKRGYFILYRDIYSNPIFKNLLQASCWIYFISSASHKDVTLRFLDSEIFIKRGEAIMPLRVTAKRFGMTYSEMRSFILRMVRRKMIGTRTAQLSQQVSIHKYNTHISNTKSNKDKGVNNGYKSVGDWGQYTILEKDGKKYKKHKWKDEPIKDYE